MTELELKDVIHAGVGAVLCGLGWLCKAGWKWMTSREYTQHTCWTQDYWYDVRESKVRFFKSGTIVIRNRGGGSWHLVNADGTYPSCARSRWWIGNSKPPLPPFIRQ